MDFTSLSEWLPQFVRITPTPMVLRSRSGYFCRAFSASSFFLRGFDRGVNSPPTYLKGSHRAMILGMRIYSTGWCDLRNVTYRQTPSYQATSSLCLKVSSV